MGRSRGRGCAPMSLPFTQQPKKRAHVEPEEDSEDEEELDLEEEEMDMEEGEEEEALLELFSQAEIIEDTRNAGDVKSGKKIAEKDREVETAAEFMQWLVAPLSLEKFYSDYWEKKPFVIRRKNCRSYYDGWFGKDDVRALLRTGKMLYGKNVDVTNYVNQERVTLNKEGTADADEVWKNFEGGCSVRMLHPQRWSDPLWLMLSTLERHWESVVGCNTYLTPPGSQGFSPHFDDIEAFVLQTEGKKHWRCYAPREGGELLPRVSSPNFEQVGYQGAGDLI
jgi:lysine-specific demethylase/histidyl-hydroxylase NO66